MERYDVAVIGGGWGGYTAAVQSARHGLRVALVERDKLGGTCLHRGCIPTKVMLQTADVLALARHAADLGVDIPSATLDYDRVRGRMDEVIGQLYRGLQSVVRAAKLTSITGTAHIAAPGRVMVDSQEELEAGAIVIATGSRPRPLPGLPFNGETVVSSDDLLQRQRVPSSVVIAGAGAVGVEFASCMADFGAAVTLVELAPRIVPLEDRDIAAGLARALSARGIRIITGSSVVAGEVAPVDGGMRVPVRGRDQEQVLDAELLLVAVGRAPVTDGLDLEALGVKTERGYVVVDDAMRTSVPGIYAVGDVNGGLQLAHVAAAEGALAADVIAGKPSPPLAYARLPRATYCRPQVASAGLTEDEAAAAGFAVKAGRSHFRANGKALIAGEPDGLVKVVADGATGDVLGVHILGAHSTELIAEVALGQLLNMAVWELAAAVHPHPTLSEAIGEAAAAAERRS